MNVLLSAYACNPSYGGEDGFGFHWTWQTAQQGHRVWCLTNPAGEADIKEYLTQHSAEIPNGRLQFTYVRVPNWVEFLYRWQFGVYLHYLVWQFLAWRVARRLDAQVNFDWVHHATFGSLQMGSWMWRLGKPLIFGPVGGGQRAPKAFKQYLPNWFKAETMRNAVGWLLMHLDPNVRQTLRHASVVLATNSETADLARRMGARRVELFLDSGLPEDFFLQDYHVRQPQPTLRLLWVGRFFPRKALQLVLEALGQVSKQVQFHLTIIGFGEQEALLPGWLTEYGLDQHVTWRGQQPWPQVREALLEHDAFMFGSLRDSFASQFLEAMASGLPIITLDHQGAHDFIPDSAGLKVPVTTPAATAAALARAVEYFYHHPTEREAMGRAGYAFARTQTWGAKADHLQNLALGLLRPRPVPSVATPAPSAMEADLPLEALPQ